MTARGSGRPQPELCNPKGRCQSNVYGRRAGTRTKSAPTARTCGCSVGVIMGLIVAVLAGLKLWFMKQRSVFAFWFTVSKQIRTSRSMPAA